MGCGASAPGSDCTKAGNVYNPGITPRDDEPPKKEKKKKKDKGEKEEATDAAPKEQAETQMTPVEGGDNKMPKNIERRLSLQTSERKRSMGHEDAEWLEAEKEQLKMIDPAKAATKEAEAKQEKEGMPVQAERKLSIVAAERRRSLGEEDSEWKEAETEQKKELENTAPEGSSPLPELPAPSFEEGGYSMDQMVGEDPPPAEAPKLEAEMPEEGADMTRRQSMDMNQRRRSMAQEDAEWMEAEQEQQHMIATGAEAFIVFNNGSAGDGVATFSFGGSHNEDFSEITHGEGKIELEKFKAKSVQAPVGSLFIGTIPDGPPVIIACPAEAGVNNPWLRHCSVEWAGSEQEELAKTMGIPPEGAPYL